MRPGRCAPHGTRRSCWREPCARRPVDFGRGSRALPVPGRHGDRAGCRDRSGHLARHDAVADPRVARAREGDDLEAAARALVDREREATFRAQLGERDLSFLLDLIGVGIVRVADDMTVEHANHAAHVFLGATPGGLVGRTAMEAFVDHGVEAIVERARHDGAANGELAAREGERLGLVVRARRSPGRGRLAGARGRHRAAAPAAHPGRVRGQPVARAAHADHDRPPAGRDADARDGRGGRLGAGSRHGRQDRRRDGPPGADGQRAARPVQDRAGRRPALPRRCRPRPGRQREPRTAGALRRAPGRHAGRRPARPSRSGSGATTTGSARCSSTCSTTPSSSRPRAAQVSARARAAEGEVVVSVEDHGVGIPRADLDRVFERFYKVDKARVRGQGRHGPRSGHRPPHRRGPRRPDLGRERRGPGRHLLASPSRCATWRRPRDHRRPGHVLALDQGTSSSRAIVFDRRARPIAQRTARAAARPSPGRAGSSRTPSEIWQTQLRAGRRGAGRSRPGGRRRSRPSASPTSARRPSPGTPPTGGPLAPAIVWQDRRTADRCAALRADGLESLVRGRTGLLLDPYFSATKMAWLLDHLPDGRRER